MAHRRCMPPACNLTLQNMYYYAGLKGNIGLAKNSMEACARVEWDTTPRYGAAEIKPEFEVGFKAANGRYDRAQAKAGETLTVLIPSRK